MTPQTKPKPCLCVASIIVFLCSDHCISLCSENCISLCLAFIFAAFIIALLSVSWYIHSPLSVAWQSGIIREGNAAYKVTGCNQIFYLFTNLRRWEGLWGFTFALNLVGPTPSEEFDFRERIKTNSEPCHLFQLGNLTTIALAFTPFVSPQCDISITMSNRVEVAHQADHQVRGRRLGNGSLPGTLCIISSSSRWWGRRLATRQRGY